MLFNTGIDISLMQTEGIQAAEVVGNHQKTTGEH